MKHKLPLFVLAFCLAACTAKPVYKTVCPAAEPAGSLQQPAAPAAELAPAAKQTLLPARAEGQPPAANTPAANAPEQESAGVNAAPAKEECAGETAEEAANQPAPEEPARELSPAERIALLRAAQPSATPVQDTPSFEDEETIPTQERRLSPFAYAPVTAATTPVPWAGEQLKYGLYYSFVKAGTAYIKTRGVSQINGREAYVIQTTAFSASVIDAFFKVRDINYSWLDTEKFYSLGYSQSVREGNYRRDEWLAFDYPANAYYGEVQKKDGPRLISGGLTAPVLDMLTSLYFVRAQQLTAGKDIVLDIINREKQYPLVVKVLKKEKIKTAAGKFNCIVVEPQFRGEGIFVSKGKSLKVWLTDDQYKMPVKMKTEVFIGSVSAELLEYKRN